MSNEDKKHRSHLPMPNTTRPQFVAYDAKDPDHKTVPIEQLRPPKGAPNVLIVLIDDAGFGSSTAFGGPCKTPNAEKLAAGGLKYNRFHTTAICSATRQALLTGRNHHSAGMARHHRDRDRRSWLLLGAAQLHVAAGEDAQAQRLQHGAVRQVPRGAGVADQPGRPVRPVAHGRRRLRVFLRLPRRRGEPMVSDALPGHHAGRTEQDTRARLPPRRGHDRQGHRLDLASRRRLHPDKPFFVYFAPGATHAPHHVPKEWADKYKGKFDAGWDKLREETFARQKKLGVIPADCQLTARPKEVPAWDDMPDGFKPVLRREMEVYAGYLELYRPSCRTDSSTR